MRTRAGGVEVGVGDWAARKEEVKSEQRKAKQTRDFMMR
jgi:hypothetical protein